ncbi:MAG: hypothetical protein KDK24_09610 [Pseudooceanicola sp.]|nr:hypothetical protein [Pseudooceanicola sp.]
MPFEVSLLSDDGSALLKLREYLSAHPHCVVSGGESLYSNPDTDVQFLWSLNASPTRSEIARLNIGHFRPSAFAAEAAMTLKALALQVRLAVRETRTGHPIDCLSDPAQLVRAYCASVQAAMGGARQSRFEFARSFHEDRHKLDSIWQWNFARNDLADELGENLSVPLIRLFLLDGTLKAGVVWNDGNPMVCPRVDIVLLHRSAFAPVSDWLGRRQPVTEVLDIEEFETDYAPWFSAVSPGALAYSANDLSGLIRNIAARPARRQVGSGLRVVPFRHMIDREFLLEAGIANGIHQRATPAT